MLQRISRNNSQVPGLKILEIWIRKIIQVIATAEITARSPDNDILDFRHFVGFQDVVDEDGVHLAVESVHDFGTIVRDVGLVAVFDFEGDGHSGFGVDG